MSQDIPREIAIKVDNMLALIRAGRIAPDPFELLAAAAILREHGEPARAARCVEMAARLLPNLDRDPLSR